MSKKARTLPESRSSYLAGAIERDKARKLLGLKPADSGAPKKRARGERRKRVRLLRPSRAADAELIEHVARESRIPRQRESLLLSSQPSDLVVPRTATEPPEDMRKNRVFRRGDDVLVRIRHGLQERAFTEHPARIKETEGATAIIERGARTERVRLADVRRNLPGSEYGVAEPEAPKPPETSQENLATGENVPKIKPPAHFEIADKSSQGELFSAFLARAQKHGGFPFDTLTKALRIEPIVLRSLEQDAIPNDDVVQRFIDVCNLDNEFDQVLAAVDRTKEKKAAEAAAIEAAKQEERARLAAAASPAVKAAKFEEFGERLSKFCPVPFNKERRAQWDTAAGICSTSCRRRPGGRDRRQLSCPIRRGDHDDLAL